MNMIDKLIISTMFVAMFAMQGLTHLKVLDIEARATTGHSITQSMLDDLKKDINNKTMLKF